MVWQSVAAGVDYVFSSGLFEFLHVTFNANRSKVDRHENDQSSSQSADVKKKCRNFLHPHRPVSLYRKILYLHSLRRTCNLGFVVPCIFNHSNKTPNQTQQSIVKCYCFVVQTLLNMFRELLCPSSGARQNDVAASGFRMNVEVEVFSAVVG